MKMQALKELCVNIGCKNVQTYIQSGNIVFNYKKENTKTIASLLSKKTTATFGFEVPILVLLLEEIQAVVNANSFLQDKQKDIAFFYVTFLEELPDAEKTIALQKTNFGVDEIFIKDKAVYLYCPNSYSSSKLTNTFIENKLKVTATTRNWKTVNELLTMGINL